MRWSKNNSRFVNLLHNDHRSEAYLKHDNEEKKPTSDLNAQASHDHDNTAHLAQQVHQDEDCSQELSAIPRHIHVLPLFVPPKRIQRRSLEPTNKGERHSIATY